MKVFTALVGASGAFAMHYTELHACAETISYGISKVADSVLSLRDHHTAVDIINGLHDTYSHTRGLHEVVINCKKIAMLPGVPTPKLLPGVPPPEDSNIVHGNGEMHPGVPSPPKILSGVPTPKYLKKNITVPKASKECFEDIRRVIGDAVNAAHAIEEANKAKTIENILYVLKDVRKVERDLREVKAACSFGEMKAEILRSPCAKNIDFAVSEVFVMEKDLKALVDGDIMRAFAMEHGLAGFPALARQVKKACLVTDLEHEADKMLKLTHVKRRGFAWGFADRLKSLAAATSAQIHKEAAKAACFGSSMFVVKDIKGLAGTIGESIKNMTLHGIQDLDHLHSHVSNALVSCQEATIV